VDPSAPLRLGDLDESGAVEIPLDSAQDLFFRLPPDLDYGMKRRLPLQFNFTIDALTRGQEAAITIWMNEAYVGSRTISGNGKDRVFRESFALPVETVFPRNTLRIAFSGVGPRLADAPRPVLRTVDSASIDFAGHRRLLAMPSLEAFANAGFPFTNDGELARTAFVLSSDAPAEQVATYLTLMSFFGSQTRSVGWRSRLIGPDEPAETDKDIVWIDGPGGELPASWRAALRLSVSGSSPRATPPVWWDLPRWLPFSPYQTELRRLEDLLEVQPNPSLVVQGLERPDAHRRSGMVFTVRSPEAPGQLAMALTDPSETPNFYGRAALLADGRLHSFRFGQPNYFVGDAGMRMSADFWFKRRLWLLPILTIWLALLSARALRVLLEIRAAGRLEVVRD
jgi:cellulose synthase (UDP-forming)